jgi:hypothetical protein
MPKEPQAMSKTPKSFSSFTTTRIGTINRDIEKNIKLVVSGSRGATGEAISSVKKRQALLAARPFKAKQPA